MRRSVMLWCACACACVCCNYQQLLVQDVSEEVVVRPAEVCGCVLVGSE